MSSRVIGVLYMPVFHKGYLDFIETLEQKGVQDLYLVSDEILEKHEELDYVNRKDRIRALPHRDVTTLLRTISGLSINSLTIEGMGEMEREDLIIHAPREDINETIIEKYFHNNDVIYHNVFLRRNKNNVGEERHPDVNDLNIEDFQREVFSQIITEAEKSADWWRKVGAALVKDGDVVAIAHNEHMPEKELPNIIGDARGLYKKGVNMNYVTSAHAELNVIGQVAQKGVSTAGTELYVTDFPCPYCARLIAKSGVKKIYFLEGYAVLDGDEFLKDAGVELVHVTKK